MKNDSPILDSQVVTDLGKVKQSGILDYRSEELPTWCPGCGYFGITHALLQALNTLHWKKKDLVFVSGIGCSSRFPFFMEGFGFHTLHGRTLPIACGVKMTNPKLNVIAVAGDGDGLAIGGGHLPHAIRRNCDITYILFDNGIYGLTKGQASPTTLQGQVTATTPYGNPEAPMNPSLLAIVYGASFVARGYAAAPEAMEKIFQRALSHRGFSFVHILSPCVTFDKENITYAHYNDQWQAVPDSHNTSDWQMALALAGKKELSVGVLFENPRPTWEDTQRKISERALS